MEIILWGVGLFLYFLPAFIAAGTKKNSTAIFWLNLLLGWSLIGWVIALIWAISKDDAPQTTPAQPETQQNSVTAEIERLKALLDSGHITQDEFQNLKAKVLSGSMN